MMPSSRLWRRLCALVVVAAAAVLAVAYAWLDPATFPLFPKCIFKSLTGFSCPGCGLQRALHATLHGHLAEAWHYNAMLPVLAAVLAAYATSGLWQRRWPRLWAVLNSPWAAMAVLTTIVLWWLLRNLLGI
ncbi:MAG: DUF2752 domain-containing protein [Bacteroidales bacterium]|nr:DUF2752 domain-containing protein [Bacteroidales bacterium]MDY3912088.1 DUF2752 domain-containing protein [Sodaliphilus sp.]